MSKRLLIVSEVSAEPGRSHANWLYYLLRAVLEDALDVRVEYTALQGTQPIEADFVIGFELSDALKNLFDGQGIAWLDLRIHPIRYLDDIFFAMGASSSAVNERLAYFTKSDAWFRMQADQMVASSLKQKRRPDIAESTLLLIGQTERDRVVFDGKRYLTLADRVEAIAELAQTHAHVLFRPHPYAKSTRRTLKAIRRGGVDVQPVYDNVYRLLSHEHVTTVAALNSSVLYEAEMFGKTTVFLFDSAFDDAYAAVVHNVLESAFWREVLGAVLPVRSGIGLEIPLRANRLRKSLNDFWGYAEIDAGPPLRDLVVGTLKRLRQRVL